MIDNQELANDIGATLRAAEASAQAEGATDTAQHLATLHERLGSAYHVVNGLLADAGEDALDWDQIAGNEGAAARSGGTPKGLPPEG